MKKETIEAVKKALVAQCGALSELMDREYLMPGARVKTITDATSAACAALDAEIEPTPTPTP